MIDSPDVSRQHAVLLLDADGLEIRDLGSRNGTRVNGERLREARHLEPDDEIEIGGEVLRVVLATLDDRWSDRTVERMIAVS